MPTLELDATVETTEPVGLPIAVESMRMHVRQDDDWDEPLLAGFIAAATRYVEKAARVVILRRTFRSSFKVFPAAGATLRLPRGPVSAVATVRYRDPTSGAWTIFSSGNYELCTSIVPNVLELAPGVAWPDTLRTSRFNAEVNYTAGYGTSATLELLPALPLQAIRLLAAHYYENREAVTVGAKGEELPVGIRSMIALIRPEGI